MTLPRPPQVALDASQKIFSGRIFDLVEESIRLPSGMRQRLVVVDHPGAVAIAALDRDEKLLIVRQYRHAIGDWLLEIPAGRIERGEEPLAAAIRELEEETRHRAREWRVLREIHPAPGFCSEKITIFLARGLEELGDSARAADGDEEFELLRLEPEALLAGPGTDAKTLLAAALIVEARRGP